MRRTGVLLMAYGAARGLEDIPAYLNDIRGGREVPQKLIREVSARYEAIGGRSPLLEISERQRSALAAALGPDYAVYLGMRHSPPTIVEVVRRIEADGIVSLVGLPLTPYASGLSTGAYRGKLEEAIQGRPLKVAHVEGWHDHPKLIEAFVERIDAASAQIPEDLRADTALLLSAHSLPERLRAEGDPYPRQFEATAKSVAEAAGFGRWRLAYQSRAAGAREPWLGPDAQDVLEELAREGCRSVLLSPIGFLSEHMETLYDCDVLYRGRAERLGMRFARAEALNDSPKLIAALCDAARSLGAPR